MVWAAGGVTAGGGLPDFDVRTAKEGRAVRNVLNPPSATVGRRAAIAADIAAAKQRLEWSIPGIIVEMHPVLGVPEVVTARGKFLTRPNPKADADQVVRNFLLSAAPLYGLSQADVKTLRTTANYTNPEGNLKWVTLEQRLNGIPVFRGELRAAVSPDGEIATMVSELVPGLDPTTLGASKLSPEQAIQLAADHIGVRLGPVPALIGRSSDGLRHRFERGPFADDITVEPIVFPFGPAKGVLAWRVLLWQAIAAYYVIVDDASGQMLFRKNITRDQSQAATFDVYASDSPAPLSPSNATPGSGIQGAAVARTRFSLVSELPSFDNLGWIPDGSNVTTGNNVDAGLDIDGIDGIDANGRAVGLCTGPSPGCRNFTFTYNPPPGGSDPPTGTDYRAGAVTDLFFWSNRYHDRLYGFGFTEAARKAISKVRCNMPHKVQTELDKLDDRVAIHLSAVNPPEGMTDVYRVMRNALAQLQVDVVNAGTGYYQGVNIPTWPIGITIVNSNPGADCYDAATFTYKANCFDTLNVIAVDPATPPSNPQDIGANCVRKGSGIEELAGS